MESGAALGRGLKDALTPAIEAFGGTLVASESHLPGPSDFRLRLVRIRAANPHVVHVTGEGTEIYAKSIELLNAEGKSVPPENLRAIMKKTTFKDTVTRTLAFDKDNDGITPIGIFELKDKKFTPLTVFMPDQVSALDAEVAKQ